MNKRLTRNTSQWNPIVFFGVSLFFFMAYFFLNRNTAFLNDDYTYRLVFEYWRVAENPVKVSSFNDIYTSMVNHYLQWGGRIPVHAMIQFLVWRVDKQVFNIINALMVVLLGWLGYFHANYGRKHNRWLFVYIFIALWFFMPQPELTMLNLNNSVNNMWVCIYVLLFLVPYRMILTRETPLKHSLWLSVASIPVGFFAGWSNEPGGAAAGSLAVAVIVYLLYNKKKPPLWAYFGVLSMAVGWAVMVFAPGYRVKARDYYSVESVARHFAENFAAIQKNLFLTTFRSLWPVFAIAVISITALYWLRKRKYANTRLKSKAVRERLLKEWTVFPEGFYVFGAFVSVLVYIVAPEFVPRYLFPAAMFLVIATGVVFTKATQEVDTKNRWYTIVSTVLAIVLFVSVNASVIYEYRVVSTTYRLTSAIEKDIEEQVARGEKNVVIKGEYRFLSKGRYNIYKYYFVGTEIYWGGKNPEGEINRLIAANFGADTYINEADMAFFRK